MNPSQPPPEPTEIGLPIHISDTHGPDRTVPKMIMGHSPDTCIVSFGDGRFCVLKGDLQGDTVFIRQAKFNHTDFGSQDLIQSGLFTHQQFDQMLYRIKAAEARSDEVKERQEYLRLHAKYGARHP